MNNSIDYNGLTLLMSINNGKELLEGDTFIVATDSDGSVYMYEDKPKIKGDEWFSGKIIGTLHANGNWKDSCRYYIKKDDEFVCISEEEFDMLNFIKQ